MTATLGDWYDGQPAGGQDPPPAAPSALEAAIASLDVDGYMRDAVRGAMRGRVDAIAAAAVDEVLDEPALQELRAAADVAAQEAVNAGPGGAGEAEAPPQPYFPDLLAFVREYLGPMYRRSLSGAATWCPEWWKHAEGIARLEALWRAWEYLRQDPHTGMSVWFRDHADHHMAVLLSADGPFKGCKADRHGERLQQLPLTEPADGRVTLR